MSTPKLVNFHHFVDSRSLRKNMSTPKLVNFPHGSKFSPSTPKLVNFPHFLDSRSLRKNVNAKTSQFSPFFWIPGVEKETCQHQN